MTVPASIRIRKTAPKWCDCVWWWDGGTERGQWRKAISVATPYGAAAQSLEEIKAEIERGGRFAVFGSTKIGAPEGPPHGRGR